MTEAKKEKLDLAILKIFIFPLLVLCLVLVSFSRLIWPMIEKTTQITKSVKEKEERLAVLSDKLSLLKGLSEPELSQRSKLVLKALPEAKKPFLVMGAIRQTAKRIGLEIEAIEASPGKIATESAQKKTSEKVPSLDFSLRLSGDLNQASELVDNLVKTLPLIRLDKISLKKLGSSDRWSISAQIKSYYLYFPQSLGKVDASVHLISKEEKNISDELKQFNYFLSEESLLPPSLPGGRADPFL